MENNTQEEPLENEINAEAVNLPDKIIAPVEAEIISPKQEAENIEAHHAHQREKKDWKSYTWEFLMLFLAVFCGFLAQNFLEHRLENEKGKQYVESMVEDIISDSTKINRTLQFSQTQQLGLDTLSVLFDNPPYNDSTIKKMYMLMMKYTMNDASVALTKRTASQLKNSGGMRLISNKISADEITKYIEDAEDIELQGEVFKTAINGIIKLNTQTFNLKYIKGVTRKNIDSFMMKASMRLANNNQNLLIEYSNQLFFTSGVLINYNSKLTNFKSEILRTIEVLKKENHIE